MFMYSPEEIRRIDEIIAKYKPKQEKKHFKIVLLGDSSKSEIRKSMLGGGFVQNYQDTAGATFSSKKVKSPEGEELTLQFWDIIDKPQFGHRDRSQLRGYLLGTSAALLVFDATNIQSFLDIPKYINELITYSSPTQKQPNIIPMALIGNNAGTDNETRVNKHIAIQYAHELSKWSNIQIPYIEINTETGKGEDELMNFLGYIEDYHLFEEKMAVDDLDKYPIEIYYDDVHNCFIANSPDLKGCSAFGVTHEEALRELKIAMKLWIKTAKEQNRDIPKPSKRIAVTH
ncbi:MAG: type II toxin-antitoxin system HicB family antitoxin [Candidatus Kariarchaeaceae archaeon]|jgi:predicted RNase H-like HicB family nuclease